ncbi:hypothetical protein N9M03_00125 [bacterium]|nr:hypothetical protein [bacterium]
MTSEWQDELVSYATNKIFLGGESIVEAFLYGKILSEHEIKRWNGGHIDETMLTPTLVTRIVELYARRANQELKIEWLYEMPQPYIDADGDNKIESSSWTDSDKVIKAIESGDDGLIIIGLSSDRDGLTPMGIWSVKLPIGNGLDFWGVPPSDLNTVRAVRQGELKPLPIDILKPGGKKIGKTIFNNMEGGPRTYASRWDCYDKPIETFKNYLYKKENGSLAFAMKITLVRDPDFQVAINWTEFPAVLI